MSLKSAVRITLAIAIFFAALGGMALSAPTLAYSSVYAQGSHIQSAPVLFQPALACIGCSGNGGGPG